MRYRRCLVTLSATITAALSVLALPMPASAGTLAASWAMDETSGTTMYDSTSNGNDGTAKNVAFGELGQNGSAYGFWSNPAVVTVPDNPSLDPGGADFTVTATLKMPGRPSAAVGDFDVIRKGLAGTAGGDWKMEVLDNGYLFCRFRGSAGGVTWRHGPNLADGAWHTVSCGRTSTALVLTVDGNRWTKLGTTGSIDNIESVFVGSQSRTGVDQYTGLMDDVSLTVG